LRRRENKCAAERGQCKQCVPDRMFCREHRTSFLGSLEAYETFGAYHITNLESGVGGKVVFAGLA
jgi:hypothetical protein